MAEAHPLPVHCEAEPDLSGRKLGDYQLLRRLGRGAMAVVYLAQQGSLRRQVALKVLKSSLAGNQAYIRRFHQEAQAAASLVHANIVQIHEVGCQQGVHFIVQEYVPGQNLKQVLARRGPFDPRLAVHVMRQVAAALHKAAEHGIVQRDIKPENILLTPTGDVKVADFGLARVGGEGQALDLTQVGLTLGTPLYMSPEQLEGRTLDPRSDLYSFGVTCYQMLSGRPPFEGDTVLSVAMQHLQHTPTPLDQCRTDLPHGLCRVIHRMLAKQPLQRYQQCGELLRDLRELHIEGLEDQWPLEIESGGAGGPWPEQTGPSRLEATQQLEALMKSETLQTSGTRGRWRWLALTVLGGLLLGASLAWVNRPDSLLEVAEAELPQVERMPSARDQYFHASLLASEAGWRSVGEYFPPEQSPQNQYYARRSKQRLAELYAAGGELQRAEHLYQELADLEATEIQFRAIGLTGLATVYSQQGKKQLAAANLARLRPLLEQLNPDIRNQLLQHLAAPLRSEFQRLMQEQPQATDSISPNGG